MRRMSRSGSLGLLGALLVTLTLAGCTKTFVIRPVTPPQNVYGAATQVEPKSLAVSDHRAGAPLNQGTLNVVLEGMGDEMGYLRDSLIAVLAAEGIQVSATGADAADLTLKVLRYRIRNLRTSAFSPYHTFTSFSADLIHNGSSQRITAYFKNSKVPVWAFREVERPCYQIPVEVIVKEVAAKINAHAFGRVTPSEQLEQLMAAIPSGPSDAASEDYLRVLELGYTNNPAAIEPLARLTRRPETLIRAAAISALGMLRATDQLPLLERIYEESDSEDLAKAMALKSIGDLATPRSVAIVRRAKQHGSHSHELLREVAELYAD